MKRVGLPALSFLSRIGVIPAPLAGSTVVPGMGSDPHALTSPVWLAGVMGQAARSQHSSVKAPCAAEFPDC